MAIFKTTPQPLSTLACVNESRVKIKAAVRATKPQEGPPHRSVHQVSVLNENQGRVSCGRASATVVEEKTKLGALKKHTSDQNN